MKHIAPIAVLLLGAASSVLGQGYETQYPYDPYSPAAQTPPPAYQQYNQPASSAKTSYSTYDAGSSSDYDKLLTYGSLSAHYAYHDFKGDDQLDGDSGFGVDLKVALMKPLYLHFGLDRITSEYADARKLEMTTLTGAVGGYIPISSRFHLFGEVGLRYDYVGGDLEWIATDEFSVFGRVGARFAITNKWELAASALFNSTDNLDRWTLEVETYYAVLSWLDLGVGADFGDETNTYKAGARWRW